MLVHTAASHINMSSTSAFNHTSGLAVFFAMLFFCNSPGFLHHIFIIDLTYLTPLSLAPPSASALCIFRLHGAI